MQQLPIGLQSFEEIRTGNFLYVDKTKLIHQLVTEGKFYFLSRPRRFGKSLLCSTLQALFEGKKDLFEGLWIENQWNWSVTNPVIYLSFNTIGYKTVGLEQALHDFLDDTAERFGLSLKDRGYDQKLMQLIRLLHEKTGEKVVLLVDEYDKPLVDYLTDLEQAKRHRDIFKAFFSVLKDSDEHLRMVFFTGVSKFSKVSVFSDLNHLDDLTSDKRFAKLVGYSQEELEHFFADRIDSLSASQNIGRDALLAQIKEWYNGYYWENGVKLYTPFSILSFFAKERFGNYWFSTGTPTFLVEMLRDRELYRMDQVEADDSIYESFTIESIDVYALLFQTGYLTIKEVDEFGFYVLGYPNREVRESFLRHLIGGYRHTASSSSGPTVGHLTRAFLKNDMEKAVSIINSLFKDIPNQLFEARKESYYHSLIHLAFRYLGLLIESEVNTSDGRMDAVVYTPERIFILEFKLDKSADEAVDQILSKGYAEKYRQEGKELLGVGINFDSQKKAVGDWKVVGV